MHKFIKGLIVCTLLVLSGCEQPKDETNQDVLINNEIAGEYNYVLPYGNNDVRQIHNLYKRSTLDVEAVGRGLLDISKEYYSPDEYLVQDGVVVGYNQLIPLLGRTSSDNTYGLNPESGSEFENGEGTKIKDAIIVRDIFEIDFLKPSEADYDLKGLSFAVVLNPEQDVDDGLFGTKVTITDEVLMNYAKEIGTRFEQYLRTKPEVGDLPILVTFFKAGSSDANLPGSFFAKVMYDGKTPKFESINERWELFPSSKSMELNPVVASEFNALRDKLHLFLPETVGVIGKGLFIDNKLQELNITVTIQAKTYLEIEGVVQYLASLSDGFVDQDYQLQFVVKSNEDTKAVLEKQPGKAISITMID